MAKYCGICGQVLKPELTGYFNRWTGEPQVTLKCPTNSCEHDGHYHDYKIGWFKETCKKCGYKKDTQYMV